MAEVILVTKAGKDISSSTPDDFYLRTSDPVLKISSFGTFRFNVAIGSTTITHNLGYIPYVIVFSQAVTDDGSGNAIITSQYYQLPYNIQGASVNWIGNADIGTDNIKVSVTDTNVVKGGVVYGFYYIFLDRMDTV
jgi:hypothetical protein